MIVATLDEMIPHQFVDDILRAAEIAVSYGCHEIYLYGSLVRGTSTNDSDIDLVVQGCPPSLFYKMVADISRQANYLIDIVPYDERDPFFAPHVWKREEKLRLA